MYESDDPPRRRLPLLLLKSLELRHESLHMVCRSVIVEVKQVDGTASADDPNAVASVLASTVLAASQLCGLIPESRLLSGRTDTSRSG